jgi:hypothetical protein
MIDPSGDGATYRVAEGNARFDFRISSLKDPMFVGSFEEDHERDLQS